MNEDDDKMKTKWMIIKWIWCNESLVMMIAEHFRAHVVVDGVVIENMKWMLKTKHELFMAVWFTANDYSFACLTYVFVCLCRLLLLFALCVVKVFVFHLKEMIQSIGWMKRNEKENGMSMKFSPMCECEWIDGVHDACMNVGVCVVMSDFSCRFFIWLLLLLSFFLLIKMIKKYRFFLFLSS